MRYSLREKRGEHSSRWLIAVIVLTLLPTHLSADPLSDTWGFVTDPLGLARAGDSVVNAVNTATASLKALQAETDRDIEKYLATFSDLIRQLETAVASQREATIKDVVRELNAFTDRIDGSVRAAIEQAVCVPEVTLNDTMRRAFGGNLRFLTDDVLEIRLPLRRPSSYSLLAYFGVMEDDVIEIDLTQSESPYKTYEYIRNRHLENLSFATADTKASDFVLVYADVARFSRFAHCHYMNDSFGKQLTREYAYFDAKVRPWVDVIQISIGGT